MAPPPRAAARKARRIIESPSGSSSEAPTPPASSRTRPRASGASASTTAGNKRPLPPDDSEVEEESDDMADDDAEGEEDEEEDAEGQEEEEVDDLEEEEGVDDVDMERSRLSSIMPSEDLDMGAEEDDEEGGSIAPSATNSTAPASALKIRLKVGAGAASTTPTGKGGKTVPKRSHHAKKGEEFDSDDELLLRDDEESLRSVSPSKLTARQRAKGNKDLQETLLQLPNELSGKKQVVLTEAERQQKREETARRRKRQSEQKLQDEQDETINRLLRAQTSRSRSKLDNPSPALDGEASGSGLASPPRRVAVVPNGMIRSSSSLTKEGEVVLRVAAPKGKEEWISLVPTQKSGAIETETARDVDGKGTKGSTTCAVDGCAEQRKYRSTKQFMVGACCLQHLKTVEAGL